MESRMGNLMKNSEILFSCLIISLSRSAEHAGII